MRKSDLYFLANMPFIAVSMSEAGNWFVTGFSIILFLLFAGACWFEREDARE